MEGEKFVKAFGDNLNRLDLAFEVLRAGLDNAYAGEVEFNLYHVKSAHHGARLTVRGESMLSWGRDGCSWFSRGSIEWETSSGHYAKFAFELPDRYEHKIYLRCITIGEDESENFYPWIRRVAAENGIEIKLEGAQEEGRPGGFDPGRR